MQKKFALGNLLFALASLSILIFFARFLAIEDQSLARRGLLTLNATDNAWNFTMSYSIVGFINRFWLDNIFLLRCFGFFLVAAGAFIFSVYSSSKSSLLFAVFFLGGMGMTTYLPNSFPEYNHIQVVCTIAVCWIAFFRNRVRLSWNHFLLLGLALGLYFAVNPPAGLLLLGGFSLYWTVRGSEWKSALKEMAVTCSVSMVIYALLFYKFGTLEFGRLHPGAVYHELAMKELAGGGAPTNILYLVLRGLFFIIECTAIAVFSGAAYFIGKWGRNKNQTIRFSLLSIPLFWCAISALATLGGIQSYKTPDLWNFSPAFFLGKIVWYGYATLLPVVVFFFLFLGVYRQAKLSRSQLFLVAFGLIVVLGGCFGSGQRIVHKALMYEWCLLYLFFLVLQSEDKSRFRLATVHLLLLVGLQYIVVQVIPVSLTGGIASYSYSLDELPRGKGLLVKKDFSDWIHSLASDLQKLGVNNEEKVVSNDYLAVYLLGLKQAIETSPANCCRIGLLKKPIESKARPSQTESSSIMRVLGPPNIVLDNEKKDKKIEDFLVQNSFSEVLSVRIGEDAKSIVYQKAANNEK